MHDDQIGRGQLVFKQLVQRRVVVEVLISTALGIHSHRVVREITGGLQFPEGPVALPDGAVLVVDGGGSLRRALLGGNLGAAAARNGWAGVVIDGCVRDVAELAVCNVGIRALACMPLPTERRTEGLRDLAVQIQGVWVRPGDWLYADEDGIVVSNVQLTG